MMNASRTIGVLITVVLLLIMSIFVNSGADSNLHMTDTDFDAGIHENTEVVGTGADASVQLELTEDGSYATGFSFDGVILSNPSTNHEYPYAIAVDTRYIYVGGYDGGPGNMQWRIEKYDKYTGEYVTEFDGDGVALSNPSSSDDYARDIVVDTQYIYIAGYEYGVSNYQWRIEKRDKTTGMLVSEFDKDGVVTSNPSTGDDYVRAIAQDHDYIFVAGTDNAPGNYQWHIEKRDKVTGALATSFATDGILQTNPSSSSDYLNSIAVDDNYIYLGGQDLFLGNYQWHIEKRDKTTGALVTAFDSDGIIQNNPSTGTDSINQISIDNGYIYIGGVDSSPGNIQWRIEKRDITTGALVTAFDTDGIVQNNPSSSSDYIYSLTTDSNSIYAAGMDNLLGNNQWRIEKRDIITGALITDFDTNGIVLSNPSGSSDYAQAIAVDSTSIYVTGYDNALSNYQWRTEKRDKISGALTVGFDTDGVITSNPSSNNDYLRDIVLDEEYIYATGYDYSQGNLQWRIEKRYKTSGALVTEFDSDGVVESNPTINPDFSYCIAVDPSYIYVGGMDYSPGNYQWRVEKRDKTTGALVTAFDTDGVVTNNPSSGIDYLNTIAVDEDFIYSGGMDYSPGNWQWRVEKRNKTTGALVTAFDSDGIVTNNPSSSTDEIVSIAIDDNYIYLGGYDSISSQQIRVEKRDKTSGALISAFGSSGVVESNPSSSGDALYELTIDSKYIYIAGTDYEQGNFQGRLEKRDINNGSLITTFGEDGVVVSNPSPDSDIFSRIAIDSNYIYAGGYDSYPGDIQWRMEKRDISTGELVTSFGLDGVVTSNPDSNDDNVYSVAVDSSHVYIAGYDYEPGNVQWRIEKYKNHVYPAEGVYTSPIVDGAASDNVVWSEISWDSDVLPPETMIKFHVAACDDGTTWDFTGPDGTADTYYETASGQPLWSGLSGRYLRYRAYFETADPGCTPTLNDVQVTFHHLDIEPPTVEVTSPDGGEDWMKGEFYPITWNARGEFNSTPVNIYYSTDNGQSWDPIINWTYNYGIYNWTVPNIETAGALIAVIVIDIYGNEAVDTSDASFAIDPPPYNPGGGDDDYTPPQDNNLPSDDSKEGKTDRGTDEQLDGWVALMVSALAVGLIVSIVINIIYFKKSKKVEKKEDSRDQKRPTIGQRQVRTGGNAQAYRKRPGHRY